MNPQAMFTLKKISAFYKSIFKFNISISFWRTQNIADSMGHQGPDLKKNFHSFVDLFKLVHRNLMNFVYLARMEWSLT